MEYPLLRQRYEEEVTTEAVQRTESWVEYLSLCGVAYLDIIILLERTNGSPPIDSPVRRTI